MFYSKTAEGRTKGIWEPNAALKNRSWGPLVCIMTG